jgi:nucleoside-diphosphate-sugar epimerase
MKTREIQGKRVLITGATGFIGANLARKLAETNNIGILVRHESNMWRLQGMEGQLRRITGDLTDYESVAKALHEFEPEIIIHSAIYGGLPSQKDVGRIFQTNVNGTINLLEACQGINLEFFLNLGSSSEYGQKTKPMNESDALEPTIPYGVAKAAATLYCRQFAKRNNMPLATARLFSPYGYYEEKTRLIPEIIMKCLNRQDIVIGNPASCRDFIFVEDCLDAFETIITSKNFIAPGEIFNVGSGTQHSVQTIVDAIVQISKERISVNRDISKERTYDTTTWIADNTKLRSLGWKPSYNIYEGLSKTFKWFKDHMNEYG